ncbi:MAG: recombination-associated protein RdgC [Candidatus Sumerlaeia bacterium]|nr:recombination-associated protein RdgC [Candidatus Sumerlaeia bacterium]
MGFMQGSATVRRYQVIDDIPEELDRTATVSIRRYSWRPIVDNKGEVSSQGWVNPRNLLEREFNWEDVLVQDGLVFLGYRVDKKSFSTVLFRARLQGMIQDVKREKKIERISKGQREALKEQLTIEMLKETSPRSTFTELIWDMRCNIVMMSSTSNTHCDQISENFKSTFGVQLHPLFPSVVGAEFIMSKGLTNEFAQATGAQGG